jgi:hypothetical protein
MISVIIPTYNRLSLLKETLASVRSAGESGYEIIVVDDGSTDGTREYIAERGDLTLIAQENAGPSMARNHGAKVARGDYLAFLDSDDLWFPWTLSIYQQVIAQTQAGFIAGKPYVFSDPATVGSVEPGPLRILQFADYLASGDEWRWWGCSSFVIKREAFDSVQGFHPAWLNGEDADMALRLGTVPRFVQITQPPTFAYRRHAVSAMKDSVRGWAGARHLLSSLQEGCYPGSDFRRNEQWRIGTRHLRPIALAALQQGQSKLAWELYRGTFCYHLQSWRWRFLLGFVYRLMTRRQPS